jgi:hypothetical protein
MTSVMGMRIRLIPPSARKHRVGPAYALSMQAFSACPESVSLRSLVEVYPDATGEGETLAPGY